jgi:putative transposase
VPIELRSRLHHNWKPGAAYFVTWRLYGSLPVGRVANVWTTSGAKFLEGDRLLDARATGPVWLADPRIAQSVVEVLHRGRTAGLFELGSWVLMPNHMHLLFQPLESLGHCIAHIKGVSAREANRLLNRTASPFRAKDYFEHRVRDSVEEQRIVRYIEKNPVKAGLCQEIEEWPWSSATEVAGTLALAFRTLS